MKKRMISVLVILALALTLLPTTAFAAGSTATAATIEELKAALSDKHVKKIRFTDNIYVGDDAAGEKPTPEEKTLIIDRSVTFDLNEYGLSGYPGAKVVIQPGCKLTIADRVKGGYPVVDVEIENHGELYGGDTSFGEPVTCYDGAAIYGGTFVGETCHVSFEDTTGKAHIYGGVFGRVYDVGDGMILHDGLFLNVYGHEGAVDPDDEAAIAAFCDAIKGGTFLEKEIAELLRSSNREVHTVIFEVEEKTVRTLYTAGSKSIDYKLTDIFNAAEDQIVTGWKDKQSGRRYNFSKPVTKDITLIPASWEAFENYHIGVEKHTVIGDWQLSVTSRNYKDVFGDGTVSYNPKTEVLTLKNAHLSGLSAGTLTLRLLGDNSVKSSAYCAIIAKNLTVMGNGSLEVTSDEYIGHYGILILKNGSYTQKSGTVILTSQEACMEGYERNSSDAHEYTLTLTGGKLICNLIKSPNGDHEHYLDGSNVLDRLTRLEIAEGGKLTFRYEDDDTDVEYQAPTSEEEKQELQDALLNSGRVTWLKIERAVEEPEPEEPELPPVGPILAGAILLAGDDNPFRDVGAADWFYQDVMYACERGLMRGTAYDKFSPQETFTRGMLLIILARHDGVNTNGTPWYQAGCDWALENGISDGKNPEEAVSREEFALILYRYAQYRGSHVLAGNDISAFLDADAVSSDALAAMQWAVAQAIVRGDNFKLNPQGKTTRAEAAAMLHRFF